MIIGYKERKESIPIEEFYKELKNIFVKDKEVKDKDLKDHLLPEIEAKLSEGIAAAN